jgi:chorismate dehydratase
MVFGKIEYLNLLPFHVFMKRFIQNSAAKATMHYKKDVPAQINKKFLTRNVDAAFISSIAARGKKHIKVGIIAKKEVGSVFILPSKTTRKDKESASSNLLADILNLKGEVLIGDKALRYAQQHNDYIDLAKEWHNKYNHPFVFALLCYHKEQKIYKKIEKNFLKAKVKIPQYLLLQASHQTSIPPQEILNYLELITYKLDTKASKGLRRFYIEAQKQKIKRVL